MLSVDRSPPTPLAVYKGRDGKGRRGKRCLILMTYIARMKTYRVVQQVIHFLFYRGEQGEIKTHILDKKPHPLMCSPVHKRPPLDYELVGLEASCGWGV
jgi:hypothetical protein